MMEDQRQRAVKQQKTDGDDEAAPVPTCAPPCPAPSAQLQAAQGP